MNGSSLGGCKKGRNLIRRMQGKFFPTLPLFHSSNLLTFQPSSLLFLVFFTLWGNLSLTVAQAETGASTASQSLHFNEVTVAAGIRFQHIDGRSGQKYFVETLGAGAAWFDYDNDGDLDLYFVNGADLPGMRSETPPTNALYRNNGDGTFTDVTVEAKVGDRGYGFGCCVGDYDNDGFKDIYITNFGSNVLYRNNGDGTFTDRTKASGVGDKRWGTGAAFADYDRDGYLDLFVVNYVAYRLSDNTVCYWASPRYSGRGFGRKPNTLFSPMPVHHRIYCLPTNFKGVADVLYRNNGDGTFTDVTQEAGLENVNGKSLGVVWGDYDNDGDPDIFIANDTTPNMLYRNNGLNGQFIENTFTDTALFAGVIARGQDGLPLSGMGTSFGDYDNDGWLDLVATNFEDDPNTLYRNLADGTFSDASDSSGIGKKSLPYLAWGVEFADLDNDGYQDIFVANGHIDDNAKVYSPSTTYAQVNQVFLNLRDGTFAESSDRCGPGLRLKKVSRGAAFGDYDNDGDIDILITNSNQTPDLLENTGLKDKNHWLVLETVGTKSNRDGIGARVKVTVNGMEQIREVKSGASYLCQSDMRLHFGLGDADRADEVTIRWPSGLVERFKDVKADQFLRAKEGEGLTVVR
jgi:hypothetical protein